MIAGDKETKVFGPGDFFVKPANQAEIALRNTSSVELAKLLLFQVIVKGSPIPAR